MKIFNRPNGMILGVFLVLFLISAQNASALPIYDGTYVDMYLKQNTFPDGLSEQFVYFDAAVATSITGHVGSQTGTTLVSFTSTTDTLDAANGYSTIEAVDDNLNNITITAPGYWFGDLIFSVNLSPRQEPPLSVTAYSILGTDPFTFASGVLGSGENRILVLSLTGNLMQSVTIETSAIGIESIKQVEISGLTTSPVPEPVSMLLFGTGLVATGVYVRRRFKKQ